jgi:glycosyltransferase involved in cell wall biosynthesis
MKILHIIRSVNPEGGGPIEGINQLSLIMAKYDYHIEVLSLDAPDDPWVKQCVMTVHALGPSLGKYGYSNKVKPWIIAHHHNYDNFVINGIWQYHSFVAHNILKKLNRPYNLFTHGMLDPWFKHEYPLKHLKKYLYWFWGEYPVIRDAAHVLFTCEDEKILARQSFWPYRCNESVINYGTAGHKGNIEEQRELFLNSFPHLQDKQFMLFLSRIHPKKGIDLLIEAFAQFHTKQPDLHLVIAGPDQVGLQKELQKQAEHLMITDKITWAGMLSGDMKWGAYLAAEAFILPSHQENFGIVVAEALSCSLPVLISNKVNIWREIAQDNAGLVEDDTVDGCMGLLDRWHIMNDNEKAGMRVNAQRCFINRFEVSKFAQSLIKIIFERRLMPRLESNSTG